MTEQLVYIVDDDEAVRDSLGLLFRSIGLQSRAFTSATEFLDVYTNDFTGCLVLDIRMPGMNGLELQDALITRESTLPIVFISGHGDIPMAVKAVKRGAIDFLAKPFRDQELLDCVQLAIKQNRERLSQESVQAGVRSRLQQLSPREREVLNSLVEGKANKVIAIELGISQRTVEVHRSKVMEKMDANSLAQLVKDITTVRD